MRVVIGLCCVFALGLTLAACSDPCGQYCDEICACDGVDEAFEAAGMGDCSTWCDEAIAAYETAGNAGDACQAALDSFNSLGGCDQYGGTGDDDTGE